MNRVILSIAAAHSSSRFPSLKAPLPPSAHPLPTLAARKDQVLPSKRFQN